MSEKNLNKGDRQSGEASLALVTLIHHDKKRGKEALESLNSGGGAGGGKGKRGLNVEGWKNPGGLVRRGGYLVYPHIRDQRGFSER